MNEVEQLVIKNLLLDEEYVRKALPFIKTEYFAEITGRKIYCEIKNGGINATFNSKHKAADYIERFKNSGCDEFVILTVEDDQLQCYWKTFVDLYISKQIAYNKCVKVGSNEFLEVFPGFNTESFLSRVKEDGNAKITSNIEKHINVLERLNNEEVV